MFMHGEWTAGGERRSLQTESSLVSAGHCGAREWPLLLVMAQLETQLCICVSYKSQDSFSHAANSYATCSGRLDDRACEESQQWTVPKWNLNWVSTVTLVSSAQVGCSVTGFQQQLTHARFLVHNNSHETHSPTTFTLKISCHTFKCL